MSSNPRNLPTVLVTETPSTAIESAVTAAVILVLSFLLGAPIPLVAGIWLFLGLIALSLLSRQFGTFSPAFLLSVVAVGAILGLVLPHAWVAPFFPIFSTVSDLTQIDLFRLNLLRIVLYTGVAILTIWVVDLRFTSAFRTSSGNPLAVNPSTLADKLVDRKAERFVSEWLGVFGAIAAFFVAVFVIFGEEIAMVAGQIAGEISRAPIVFGAVVTDILAFASLGGDIPILPDLPIPTLSANEFALVAAVILVVAAAANEARKQRQ